ncbi:MAG: hypothetical protein MRZ19_07430 [Helicobacter sp.]|nr:hypothetical protein [Helicobacter sp.]
MPNVSREPVLVGVYDANFKLYKDFVLTAPLSDALVPKFMELEKQGIEFDALYFVRGPGSFMALKLLYLFAKTLEIAKGVKLFATHAFYFNANSPIKAYGNCYFVRENTENNAEDGICVKNFATIPHIAPFSLPKVLDITIFDTNLKPLYLLPPV